MSASDPMLPICNNLAIRTRGIRGLQTLGNGARPVRGNHFLSRGSCSSRHNVGSGFEKDRRPKIISGGIHRLAAMDLLEDMSGSVPEPSVRHFDEIALVCLKYKADVECPD